MQHAMLRTMHAFTRTKRDRNVRAARKSIICRNLPKWEAATKPELPFPSLKPEPQNSRKKPEPIPYFL